MRHMQTLGRHTLTFSAFPVRILSFIARQAFTAGYMVCCCAYSIDATVLESTCILAAPLVAYLVVLAHIVGRALRLHLNLRVKACVGVKHVQRNQIYAEGTLFTKVGTCSNKASWTGTSHISSPRVCISYNTFQISLTWPLSLTKVLAAIIKAGVGIGAILINIALRSGRCGCCKCKKKSPNVP